jgi:hypothetical protein
MFHYQVSKAIGGGWEVTFGLDGTRFLYGTRKEAMRVACAACRSHWNSRREPCSVIYRYPQGRRREFCRTGGDAMQALAG